MLVVSLVKNKNAARMACRMLRDDVNLTTSRLSVAWGQEPVIWVLPRPLMAACSSLKVRKHRGQMLAHVMAQLLFRT